MCVRVFAVEPIRRMHGGAQSHLIRCSDGGYYVVKFQNNPQGTRTLANELLATLIAKKLGLSVPEPAIVEVQPEMVRLSDELVIQHRHRNVPCHPGLCFDSLYGNGETFPGSPKDPCTYFPESQLNSIQNISEFLGMLVFDRWTGNTDPRQTILVPAESNHRSIYRSYRALMIDNGLCFNGARWNFPDVPKLGLFQRRMVYAKVTGIKAFEPWLNSLNRYVNREVLDEIAQQIPSEWYGHDSDALAGLLACLDERRKGIMSLLLSTRKASPESFPAWLCPEKTLLRCPAGKQMDHSQQFSR
jgi:hypothetical protein